MDGSEVWPAFQKGEIRAAARLLRGGRRQYYLLYLRFQMMRCVFTPQRYAEECALLRTTLEKRSEPHWQQFLSLWQT
jgi:hypothetical protein